MAVTGKSNTNKSYKLGVQYALEDLAAGLPRRLTYLERKAAREAGVEAEYRPMPQPRGYYASEMDRGYQETWKKAMDPSRVPEIHVNGKVLFSDAIRPRAIPDTAACWKPAALRSAKMLLTLGKTVTCNDATAYAAATSLALVLLLEGNNVTNSQIERAYEVVS